MKKILTILSLSFLLFSCGKKSYEHLTREEIAILSYNAEVLGDVETEQFINDIRAYLEDKVEKEENPGIQEQIEWWNYYMNRFEYTRSKKYGIFEAQEYPKLNEVFGKPENGVDSWFRLVMETDEKSGEKVIKDILNKEPYSGIDVIRKTDGNIENILRLENGRPKEQLVNVKFTNEGKKVMYIKDKKAYKIRYYDLNGEFKSEEIVE